MVLIMIKNIIDAKKNNFIVIGEPHAGQTECIATILNRSPNFTQHLIPNFDHFTMLKMTDTIEIGIYEANFSNFDFLINAGIINFDFLMNLTILLVVPYEREDWDYKKLSGLFDKLKSAFQRTCCNLTPEEKLALEKRFISMSGKLLNVDADFYIPIITVLHRYDLFLKDSM